MIDYSYKRPGRPRKEPSTHFSKWLIDKMDEYDLKSIDVAKLLNVSNGYISKLTRGSIIPTTVMIYACAAIFEEDPNVILYLATKDETEKEI